MTQPQGHSTSGSHERYKSKERLRFETEFDPIRRMRAWILGAGLAEATELDELERAARADVERIREQAWEAYQAPIRADRDRALRFVKAAADEAGVDVGAITEELRGATDLSRRLVQRTAVRALAALRGTGGTARAEVAAYVAEYRRENDERFNSYLTSRSEESPLLVKPVPARYSDRSETVDGRQLLVRCFDENLKRDPRIVIIGEDVGKLGDVNLVFEGLQAKHGELRVTDTGIREATIVGQGIGAALRGLRPIVDIQYVDYLLYALQVASDDLATLHFRTAQEAAEDLVDAGIRTEVVDVQTLLPFDVNRSIVRSVAKTGALVVVDEDVPGGASAYILREILEVQGGIDHLEVPPRTLTAKPNRVAVGNDGDYFSKPNREDIFGAVYGLVRERRPDEFPPLE